MKVLLINSPIRLEAAPSCIPYGLATVAATLIRTGFDVEIYDINALRHSKNAIIRELKKRTWDVVGVSGLITTYRFQKWIIQVLNEINPHAPIISGGGLATTNSRLLFDHSPLDIAVISEGEHTMRDLCRSIAGNKNPFSTPGIVYRKNGNIAKTPHRRNIENLDSVPFPAWDLLPMEVYLKNPIWGDAANNSSGFRKDIKINRSMNIISSRGCPMSCNYCYHLFGRSDYRLRSVENVIQEMEILVDRYDVDFIGFVDDNMMVSEKRMIEFCDAMEEKKFPITWGCHGRVTGATPEILDRMADVGCVWIGYGIESGSQRILDAMNKNITVEQAKAAIRNTRAAGIYPNTTFIFGYPGETVETVQETVDFKHEMGIECGSFFATPYPDTSLYDQVRPQIQCEEHFISRLGNATEFSINLTGFDEHTLFALKKAMDQNRAPLQRNS